MDSRTGLDSRPPVAPGHRAALLPLSLGLLLWACGGSDASAPDRPDDAAGADWCPAPGFGVQIGGELGAGKDHVVLPDRRVVLMGGGSEDDLAARAFVEGAQGGDVVILRASGSVTSYPAYFTTTLSPTPGPSSVVTLLTSVPSAAMDPAVGCWMDRAEAVWIAGGNQWDYLGGWPASFQSRLAAMEGDGLAVGGTSAGAMVMGEAAFNARHGTVTSADALADPLRPEVSVGYPPFSQPELQGILVDTHFTERGREGRLLAFLARFLDEKGYAAVTGIGLDEEVAVILEDGSYTVSTAGDGGLWAYRVEGPATLRAGEPLALYGIRRIRLENGDTGVWPLDFEAASTQALQVENGVVGPGS